MIMFKINKTLKYYFLLMIAFAFIIAPYNVFALNKDSKYETESNDGNDSANKTCKKELYNNSAMIKSSCNNEKCSVTINASEGLWKIRYYSGDFDLTNVFGANKMDPSSEFEYKGGSPHTITIDRAIETQDVLVLAELKGKDTKKGQKIIKEGYGKNGKVLELKYGKNSTTTCRYGSIHLDNKNNVQIDGTGSYLKLTVPALTAKISRIIDPNSQEYQECRAMSEGRYEVNDTESYLVGEKLKKYNDQMKKSFPYCYRSYSSSFDITAKTIEDARKKSLVAYKAYLDFLEAKNNNKEYHNAENEIGNENYKELTYSSRGMDIKKLSCDKFQTTEKTERFFVRTTEVDSQKDKTMCDVTCQEQIQITYDPPVATHAGLCFQYKVTVKSKVTCKTIQHGEITWPTPPSTCAYTPICSDNESETQAGPNEEFDSCIKKCDGGKYSQSCINSCYNKVYGKSSSQKSDGKEKTSTSDNDSKTLALNYENNDDDKIIKLSAYAPDPYKNVEGCKTNQEIHDHFGDCGEKFSELKVKYPFGYVSTNGKPTWADGIWVPCANNNNAKCKYYKDGKEIKFETAIPGHNKYTTNNPNGDKKDVIDAVKRAVPYYFKDKTTATKTLKSFWSIESGYNGYGEARHYIIDENGIKRQYSSNYKCDETCGVLKDDNDDTSKCKNSDKEIRNYYNTAFENITSKLSKCTSKAECKENTATFDMSVDNNVMTVEDKEKSSWYSENNTKKDETCINPTTGDIGMFIPLVRKEDDPNSYYDRETGIGSVCSTNPNGINGKCYGKDNSNYWQHYKTTITFPGTWMDLKTGKRVYKKEYYNESTMKEKPNYYCVGYNYEDVNRAWFNWKESGAKGSAEKIILDKDDNITATIGKFGKYNWNISLKCFYALSSEVPTYCEGEACNETVKTKIKDECNNENSTALCNTQFRPVNQQNLFPSADGTGSRAVGFNWTSAATDKSPTVVGTSYGIDPGEYAKKLQQEAATNENVAYSGTADYSVHLTKDNIKNLRSYVKENGYTSYQGNNKNTPVEKVDGLYYYTSNILNNNSYISQFSRTATLGKNND